MSGSSCLCLYQCGWRYLGSGLPTAGSGVVRAHAVGTARHRAGGRDPLRLAAVPRAGLLRGAGGGWLRDPGPLGSGRPQRLEADLAYFADERRDLDHVRPLVLVECKRAIGDFEAAAGQVRSYALWALPAYYVVTDAWTVNVWDFQGAVARDVHVLTLQQAELAERYSALSSLLNPQAALTELRSKAARLEPAR